MTFEFKAKDLLFSFLRFSDKAIHLRSTISTWCETFEKLFADGKFRISDLSAEQKQECHAILVNSKI